MTNHWIDIGNSDAILIMGSNAAENHPISMRWVNKARADNGAKMISVDPRFTRTSAVADLYAPLRSGTDIAFLGGMINYILQNDLIQDTYVKEYTNASFLVNTGFDFTDGLFNGYNAVSGKYDKTAWAFQTDGDGVILKDKDLADPQCVYQLLKTHYSRYDVATVSGITGTPEAKLTEVYETYAASGAVGKAGTIMYAMGWTQHTVGAQNIRAMALIQLLLGNIGVAGGGVNALRGESNVQGSTDHCLLYHILPGYLKTPKDTWTSLDLYNESARPRTTDEPRSANWWQHTPEYMASFLKSMYGTAATSENEFAYHWLPKIDATLAATHEYAWQPLFDAMYNNVVKGFFAWGQNPACSSGNADKIRQALGKLDWLVCTNIYSTETSEFWRGPGMDPASIDTEVYELPAAASIEKEGSITNSGRWGQWRYKAIDPPGDAKPDAEILNELFTAVKNLYSEGDVFPEPILNLKWDYFADPALIAHEVAKEINGYHLVDSENGAAGDLVTNFTKLADDGTTSSGNWLYCQSYNMDGNNMARQTASDPATDVIGLNAEWAWCWPINRRVIYNRASVDLKGAPWDAEHKVISWDPTLKEGAGGWAGDVPDGGWAPMQNADGTDNPVSKLPFIMRRYGMGQIFGAMTDGPFPEHYEPLESPLATNPMGYARRLNPAVVIPPAEEMSPVATPGGSDYPIVCSTYRVTEHWQTGVMTRWIPWLNELQPEMFVEMSEELAAEKSIANGDRVLVTGIRQPAGVQAVAIVTKRFKPFTIQGETVHQVGIPWSYGWVAPNPDATRVTCANLLTPNVGDPNTRIPESKAFMVDVVKEA